MEGGREGFDNADVASIANCSQLLLNRVREWGIQGLRDVEGLLQRFNVSPRDVNNVSLAESYEANKGADGGNEKKETLKPAVKDAALIARSLNCSAK